jgi:hypothetical protein
MQQPEQWEHFATCSFGTPNPLFIIFLFYKTTKIKGELLLYPSLSQISKHLSLYHSHFQHFISPLAVLYRHRFLPFSSSTRPHK